MMLRTVFTKALWDQRRAVVAWGIGLGAIVAMYAVFYPSVRQPGIEELLNNLPEPVLRMFAMEDLTSAEGYLDASAFGLLGPIVMLIFTTIIGARAVAGDEESGSLDLLLAHPVSRWSLLLQRWAALVVLALIVVIFPFVTLTLVAGPSELEIPLERLGAATVHLAAIGIFFGSLAMAVGAATGRRGWVVSVVAAVGVVTYFTNTIAPSISGLEWLQQLSPFYWYSAGEPLRNGLALGDLGVLVGASAILIALGGLRLQRRDIAV